MTCYICGCELTLDNKANVTNKVCKDCHNRICREYKKRRRENDPDFAESERQRAKKYYHSEYQQKRDDFWAKYKTPCVKCGESRLYCICFHHIDYKTKQLNIGGGTPSKDKMDSVLAEIPKCVCLCSNCHREFHHLYGNKPEEPVKALEAYTGKSVEEMRIKTKGRNQYDDLRKAVRDPSGTERTKETVQQFRQLQLSFL